jgi:hypothetical protein
MAIIRPLALSVILLCAIEILQAAKAGLSDTAILIIAIIAVILALADLLAPLYARHPAPPPQ